MLQNGKVWLAIELAVQFFDIFFSVVFHLLPIAVHKAEVALYIPIGTAASGSL